MGILVLVDALICGAVAFGIVKLILGDKALGRALAVIVSIIVGVSFFVWANTPGDQPMWMVLVMFLGPIGSFLLLVFLKYVFAKK